MGRSKVKEWLASFDMVLTDCDGVLWLYNDIIGKAPHVINKFVENGKKVFFITNNSTKTRDEFADKAKSLNFNIGVVSIFNFSKTLNNNFYCFVGQHHLNSILKCTLFKTKKF